MSQQRKDTQSATPRKTEHAERTERAVTNDQKKNWSEAGKGDEVPVSHQASDGKKPMAGGRSI